MITTSATTMAAAAKTVSPSCTVLITDSAPLSGTVGTSKSSDSCIPVSGGSERSWPKG